MAEGSLEFHSLNVLRLLIFLLLSGRHLGVKPPSRLLGRGSPGQGPVGSGQLGPCCLSFILAVISVVSPKMNEVAAFRGAGS